MELIRTQQNNEALYYAATLLKDLNEQVVYVGGRIVGLLRLFTRKEHQTSKINLIYFEKFFLLVGPCPAVNVVVVVVKKKLVIHVVTIKILNVIIKAFLLTVQMK